MAETARADAAKSNVSDDTIAKAERDYVESLEKLETAKGRHRNMIKVLKGYGVNVDILKTVIALKRQDPEDVLGNQKDFIRYARIQGLAVGTQLTLLDEEIPDVSLSEQARRDQEAWDCGQAGFNAGKNSEPSSNNPYPPGQLNHAAWAEGHKRGVELKNAGGAAKRGRPKKVAPEPDQQAA